MSPKVMSKIEAATWAAIRVFAYAAATFLAGAIAANVAGGTGQVPNLETLKGWIVGAVFVGGTAVVTFVKNLAAPRSQIVTDTPPVQPAAKA